MSTDTHENNPHCDGKFGQICWLEIPVTDVRRAIAFYRAVFDWCCKDESMPHPLDSIQAVHFFMNGTLNGAFLVMFPEDLVKTAGSKGSGRQSALATYCVADIEETLRKVEKAGGAVIVPKTAIGGDMGSFARFVDTDGNLQGIWDQTM
ncbi:Glyoxalase/Bleomycin resistance protein/Dihydroxybiphenyl dioxygenase [Pseudomassariella vexata]|uniref:Glyoxalase/Bleomycin resistance protein/Dihydroxybiphenyl dioxygenase n=1 Tax=Pseudomassariella vexata TaxID=1141098 RepID=A0A1Y2E0S8_9PEZI|nr:Glyoxalase/Bleomycin resistance protein/Dihydroxybiphenyl dioxygenase [Pseudomassariella vexata]ORY65089.1 Glyoxalase/Bleomycin resistance protein/Dihydroxybiphenyl dioxygenase [Pseudomassariella vexata]